MYLNICGKSLTCVFIFSRISRAVQLNRGWAALCVLSTSVLSEGLKQWVKPGESAPERPKTQQSAGKVMASVFRDAHGVIFIDYLEKGRTITEAYYVALLDRLVK